MQTPATGNGFSISTNFGTSVVEGSSVSGSQGPGQVLTFSVNQNPIIFRTVYAEIAPLTGQTSDFWDNFWSNTVGGEPADQFALSTFVGVQPNGTVSFLLNADLDQEEDESFEFRIFSSNIDAALGNQPLAAFVFTVLNDDLYGTGFDDVLSGRSHAEILFGMAGDDTLNGADGNDTLSGGDGNDLLNGGAGADALIGGSGIDTADYTGSTGSLRVDLQFSQINTNVAAGDTYDSIENLIGSQGFDNLRGSAGVDNLIRGMANVDYIFGRSGMDTLEGGIGDDVLFGGLDADVLIGGANRDRAQYSESLTGLLLDLNDPSRNTGEAAGDTYDSIEDLAGGFHQDTIYGDAGSNRLFGREGNDTLFGRAGNDYLNGGANSDRLEGGAGDDTLRGGQASDTFVFNGGADVIEDFRFTDADRIEVDRTLTGGVAQSGADLVARASVVAGAVVFDFGQGNTLVLQGLASLDGLDSHLFGY